MSYSIKDEQGNWHQVTGDSVEVFLGATASAKGRIGLVPDPQAGDQDKFLGGDGSWKNVPNPQTMTGATSQNAGTGGLTPTPGAGDEDKVLQGNGTFGKKLQMDIVIQNNVYGYIGANNTFIPFKSQSDIDAAVSAAKVGNAVAGDVLSGKTFTNSTTSGDAGTMPDNSTRTSNGEVPGIQSNYPNEPVRNGISSQFNTGTDGVRRFAMAPPKGYYPGSASYIGIEAQTKTCTPSTSQQTISRDSGKVLESVTVDAIQTQEKTVTAGTSAASVTPDSGKYLSKVTYNPTPSQSKTVTSSRSVQTVTPDSGKLLSSVTVNGLAPTGTFTTDTIGSAVDMGETSNYRYVNTNNVAKYAIAPSSNSYVAGVIIASSGYMKIDLLYISSSSGVPYSKFNKLKISYTTLCSKVEVYVKRNETNVLLQTFTPTTNESVTVEKNTSDEWDSIRYYNSAFNFKFKGVDIRLVRSSYTG